MPRLKTLISTSLLLIPIVAFLISEFTYLPRVAPPSEGTNLRDFLRSRAIITRLKRFQLGGSNYVMVVGKIPFSIHGASGPPVYVFDAKGELIDWAAERGDATQFQKTWIGASNVVDLPLNKRSGLARRSSR